MPHCRQTAFAQNAPTHSNKQIRQIADSIRSFGFLNPVLIDAAGEIIAGHGRVIEYDPIYCDTIIARWQALTGKVAVHVETGLSREDLLVRRSADLATSS